MASQGKTFIADPILLRAFDPSLLRAFDPILLGVFTLLVAIVAAIIMANVPSRKLMDKTIVFSMRHVNSKNSVEEWRSPGVLSEGASEALVMQLPPAKSARIRGETDQSYVSSLIEDLMWAVTELRGPHQISMKQAEDWAIFLHGTLTDERRAYHGIAHVFKIAAGASPIQLLAAFFRDVISYYVDVSTGLDPRRTELLKGVFEPGTFILSKDMTDPRDACIVHIFGYPLGMDLAPHLDGYVGLDIFVSALLAARLMKDALTLSHVVQLAACLEATIPFRKTAVGQDTPLEVLYKRVQSCNQLYGTDFSEQEIIVTVQQATDSHNRSCGNMATEDLAEFLDHTWRLLPEQHESLRQHALYTLTDYYTAIQSMAQLTKGLEPSSVFVSYKGVPSANELQRFHTRLQSNSSIAQHYIQARLFSVAVVSALACLTGGDDAPKAFFFGDLPTFHRQSTALGDGLVQARDDEEETNENQVYYLLLTGKGMSDFKFDARKAPLAAFLLRELGFEAMTRALTQCEVPMTQESSWTLLRGLPRTVVEQVGNELARVALSRKKWIDRFLEDLKKEE
jgi:hypothetical protein